MCFFATKYHETPQLGYIFSFGRKRILPSDLSILFKPKRSTNQVSGSELTVFVESTDMAYTVQHDMRRILKNCISLSMFRDCHPFFDNLLKLPVLLRKDL